MIEKKKIKLFGDDGLTHMPFLMEADGKKLLFHCICDRSVEEVPYRPWKIAWSEYPYCPKTFRIDTGFGDDVVECSPSAWYDGLWHVSFIAGGSPQNPPYRLYVMEGENMESLSAPKLVCKETVGIGYLNQTHMVTGNPRKIEIQGKDGNFEWSWAGFDIYRATYRSDKTEKILITGKRNEEFLTVQYDIKTGETNLVTLEGSHLYKCSIFGDAVVYAQRNGDFEERDLFLCFGPEFKKIELQTRQ